MKPSIFGSLMLMLSVVPSALLLGYGRHCAAEKDTLTRSVLEFGRTKTELETKKLQSANLSAEGAERYTYQIAQSTRAALPTMIDKALLEDGLQVMSRPPARDANQFALRYLGEPMDALKWLRRIEVSEQFSSLRPRQVQWTSQPDGKVTVDFTADIWAIKMPDQP